VTGHERLHVPVPSPKTKALRGRACPTHTLNDPKKPQTLIEAIRYFSDLDICTDFVAKLRWPDGPICPRCGGTEHSYLTTRRLWKCKACKRQFSVKVGTIFEDSPLGLDKWLPAVWLAANSKNGVSSHELARARDHAKVGVVHAPSDQAGDADQELPAALRGGR
jgi:transposase-like protein